MSSEYGQEFSLWNPAIGQLMEISLPLQHSENRRHLLGGFTWDHLRNDYKVLLVCQEISRKICIYSSNSASWTEVDILDHSMLPDESTCNPMAIMAPSTIVKGIPYWMSTNNLLLPGKKRYTNFIQVYKFVVEINQFRSLPLLDSDRIRDKAFIIVNIKNCLVGLASNYRTNLADIYSLDEESPSSVWSKMYTMKPIIFRSCLSSQCLRNNSETLIASFAVPLSVIDRKIKGTTELVEFHRGDGRYVKKCFNYTPSLVRVQGMKSMLEFLRCRKSNRLTLKMSKSIL